MAIVGTAEIQILADDTKFPESLKAGTAGPLKEMEAEAGAAGNNAGLALAEGEKKALQGEGKDLAEVMAAGAGPAGRDAAEAADRELTTGLKDAEGSVGKAADDIGAALGPGLGRGGRDAAAAADAEVKKGLKALEGDAEAEGGNIGSKLTAGLSSLLGGLGSAFGSIGGELGPFEGALDKTKEGLRETEGAGGSLMAQISGLGGTIAKVGVVGFGAAAAGSLLMASNFEGATARMAAAGNIPQKVADQIGQAFLNSGKDVVYSAQEEEQAYGAVAGQLSTLPGFTNNVTDATKFMAASMDLAEESGSKLGATTGAVTKLMQSFQIPIGDIDKLTTALANTSRLTGNSVEGLADTMSKLKGKLGVAAPDVTDLSSLLVELQQNGVSGSRGLMMVNSALNGLLKPIETAQKNQDALKQSMDDMPPSMQKLAQSYMDGKMTAAELTKATKDFDTQQQASWATFTQTYQQVSKTDHALDNLGVQLVDSKGNFVGLQSVIEQVGPKLKGMSEAQQLAYLSQLGLGNSAKSLLPIFLAGAEGFDKSRKAVNDAAAAHHALEVQQHTLAHELEGMKVVVENLGTKFGLVLMPYVKDALQGFADFFGFLESHKAALYTFIGIIGTAMAAAVAVWAVNVGQKMVNSAKSAIESIGKLLGIGKEQAAATEEQASASAETGTSAEEASTGVNALADALERAAESAQQLATTMGEMAANMGEGASGSEELGTTAETATASLEAETEAIQALVEAQAELAASGPEAAAGNEALAGATETVTGATEAEEVADVALIPEEMLALGPILLIIGAVALLVVGIYELVTHWKTVWNAIKEAVSAAVSFITGLIGGIVDWIKGHWQLLLAILTGPFGLAVLFIKDHISQITGFVSGVIDWVKGHWQLLLAILTGPFGLAVLFIKDHISQITGFVGGVIDWVKSHWQLLLAILTGPFGLAVLFIKDHLGQIVDFVGSIVAAVTGFFAQLWGDVTGWVTRLVTDVVNFFTNLWSTATGLARRLVDEVIGFYASLYSTVFGWVARLVGDVVGFFEHLYSSATGTVNHLVSEVVGLFTNLWNEAKSAASGLVNDVVNFFEEMPGRVANGLSNLVDIITGPFQGIPDWINNNIIQPIVNFFENLPGRIGDAVSGIGNAIINHLPGAGFIKGALGDLGIPGLAEGGYVDKPTLIVAGEAGPEWIIPAKEITAEGLDKGARPEGMVHSDQDDPGRPLAAALAGFYGRPHGDPATGHAPGGYPTAAKHAGPQTHIGRQVNVQEGAVQQTFVTPMDPNRAAAETGWALRTAAV